MSQLDDCLQAGNAYLIKTNAGLYLCLYLLNKVGVRVLSDPTGVDGSWVERYPVSEDWRNTAILMVGEWERTVKVKNCFVHSNRNVVWAAALKEGTLILDSFISDRWYCTVFEPLEKC